MESMRQSMRPKHQVLILKCFPRYQKGVLEVKPNPSELAYLLYYASTRRSKLQKVGAFLEKKTARDVYRGRIGNVQVTLQILTALIEKLPRELPLYAHSILNILETVLRSNDFAMVEDTLQTFETFCTNQDLAVLAAERRYSTQYEAIVRSYAAFASSESIIPAKSGTSLPTNIRWKNIGLKAIRSIVSSEGLNADGGKQLSFIVPVILENVYDGGDHLLVYQRTSQFSEKSEPEQARRRRAASTVTVQTIDTADGNVAEASGTTADADKVAELEVRLLALRCLERIFVVSSNRSQIRTAAGLVLQFIVSNRNRLHSKDAPQDHGKWANSLMDLITEWCPVQDRFIVLFAAVEILRGISIDGQPYSQQIVVASLIDYLLKSPVNMIGLSVIDVLVGFVQHLLRLLQGPSSQTHAAIDSTTNGAISSGSALSEEQRTLVSLLKRCIADLATHTYYADQISDMIRTILKRIRSLALPDAAGGSVMKTASDPTMSTNHIASTTSERHFENYFFSPASHIVALEAVKDILHVANQSKAATGPGIEPRNKVGIQVWEGTNWLLRNPERSVRLAYVDAFVCWLDLETTKGDLRAADAVNNKPTRAHSKREHDAPSKRSSNLMAVDKAQNHASSVFLQLLHMTIYETAIEYAEVKEDIFVIHLLLVNLVNRLGVNAVRFGLPMTLKLQQESFGSATAQINIGSLVYGYLNALSKKFDFETSMVGIEIHSEISSRKNRHAWLEMVLLPPLPLDKIPSPPVPGSLQQAAQQESLRSFTSTEKLVREIEDAYTAALNVKTHSPPASPGKQATSQTAQQCHSTTALPADVKDDMLSVWSKEACMEVLERERTRAVSLAGSKAGTSIKLGHGSHLNGYGSGYEIHTPNDTGSPTRQHGHNHVATSSMSLDSPSSTQGYRRSSSRTDGSPGVSSRDSTIRVNDLKRMLTVSGNSNVRRSSPLRGHLDTANGSILSSSSESFVSGTFSASDYDAESRPQSVREGSETPKAVSSGQPSQFQLSGDIIPPVPPLPSGLAIPGGFPDSNSTSIARQNSTRSEGRSSTSASPIKPNKVRGNGHVGRSLSGKRTRSYNSLQKTTNLKQQQQSGVVHAENVRRDIENLLSVILPPDNTSGGTLDPVDAQNVTQRRIGSIGRPPY